ncbi:MAG: ABC transporter permease [Planctomycetota bacterium]
MRIASLFNMPGILIRHRELLWSFIWRDLKARYEGSLLGRLWPILNPLIMFLVYYFVFAVIMNMKLEDKGVVIDNKSLMGLYIICGIIPWVAFSDSIMRCTSVVLENGNLVKKIAFPSQLLPVYAVAVNTIYFLIGLGVFLLARLLFFYDLGVGGVPGLPSCWPMLLLIIPLQAIFTVGLGLFLGAFNIFIRDTSQVMPLILQFWFFTTPIVYPDTMITDNLPEYAFLMQLNPIYHLMDVYRSCLLYDYHGFGGAPWLPLGIFAGCAVLFFLPGYAFFLKTRGRFADEL